MSTLEVNKITPSTGTDITLGDSGDTFTIPSGVTLTNNGSASGFGGITEADSFRLTASKSGTGDITANLSRVGSVKIGTGMTESSGIFSFPSTGIYRIQATFDCNASAQYYIKTTTDNSTYTEATLIRTDADNNHTGSFLFDVTNTTTHKVKFVVDVNTGVTTGNASFNRTYFEFIRLGDT